MFTKSCKGRSRKGCMICKRKKIKCDEIHPRCQYFQCQTSVLGDCSGRLGDSGFLDKRWLDIWLDIWLEIWLDIWLDLHRICWRRSCDPIGNRSQAASGVIVNPQWNEEGTDSLVNWRASGSEEGTGFFS
ncbi:hypothetical protein L211DRAFT_672829 [Terfezia boudieri ATCC MYA-4762]|uniref:Zn(2)-C6 fungal-type domain-containing protein n=1 Tax=Terfezia boudieri ATCC MYA-4762 TaxID=1051890 RepID=A0A3N4L7R7_9PEZI|nr:hypothetical protein L211DRAFT_672829 [Terfezia boudieri ATCC MYA-4762]